MKKVLFFISFFPLFIWGQNGRQTINFNSNWKFCNQEDLSAKTESPWLENFDFNDWTNVTLPRTAKVEPLTIVNPWEGISWYAKEFTADSAWKNKKISIQFDAIMQKADVWLNGKHIYTNYGGYLPFCIDISDAINYEKANRIIVKTDNTSNPEIPPGKSIQTLDFCYYSGIYRNVSLIVTELLHITNSIKENLTASGGIKIWYPVVTKDSAQIAIATHIRNDYKIPEKFNISYKLINSKGEPVIQETLQNQRIIAKNQLGITDTLRIKNPRLWHPNHPDLYKLVVEISQQGKIIDRVENRIGIRKFEIKNDQFWVNNEPLLLIGTNRHQEYPYIGNALSDNAQYRDVYKIKQAGFNIVRLSHYPQSPAFMKACDELGILAIDAIPGWQFVGDSLFKERSYQNARELIRRDRNHACVAIWELSLNESPMPDSFMKQMNNIAKEEFPETKLITCGWIDKYYDVFIPARQHAKPPFYWKKYSGKIPLFTGEYGDWEYYAQDAGLNQAGYAGLTPNERTSRQLRRDGEKRLLQQAINFQEAHNDNLRNPHLGDANWLMFDYNRGYSPDIESSGIMDMLRLPKFSYYMYRSQSTLPTLKIASYWNKNSDFQDIKVFSNCDEVALYLNGKLIGQQKAERNSISDKLPHAPFIFHPDRYEPGTLKAVGYRNNKKVATDKISTAGKAAQLKISYDLSSKPLEADGADAIFVYVTICDKKGHPVFDAANNVSLTVSTGAEIISPKAVAAEAGIATFLLKAGNFPAKIRITAKSEGLSPAKSKIKSNINSLSGVSL
ncbi:MAG: glycoside hydrolase family 2 TIM barrel-domain containing protein [Paludibacter sp.]|nr:glycoside hydrolase family 2 TIM barrel-domain containing protein [Paludibacter sp.]